MVPTKTVGLKSLHLQGSRVHYTLAGIKSVLKIREVGSLAREGVSGTPATLPWLRPCQLLQFFAIISKVFMCGRRMIFSGSFNMFSFPRVTCCLQRVNTPLASRGFVSGMNFSISDILVGCTTPHLLSQMAQTYCES